MMAICFFVAPTQGLMQPVPIDVVACVKYKLGLSKLVQDAARSVGEASIRVAGEAGARDPRYCGEGRFKGR